MNQKITHKFLALISWITGLNFVLFIIISLALGGDALNGKIESNNYYLGFKGNFVKVSRATYIYSKYHAISVILTIVLTIGIGFIVYKLQK